MPSQAALLIQEGTQFTQMGAARYLDKPGLDMIRLVEAATWPHSPWGRHDETLSGMADLTSYSSSLLEPLYFDFDLILLLILYNEQELNP